MALWEFTNKNKYGNLRSRVVYRPDGEPFSYNPKGLGNFVAVRSFKYMSQSPFHPALTIGQDGKKYMIPDWIEVLPETTLNDIKPFEEETRGRKKGTKKIENPNEWRFESKSDPGSFYVVKQVSDFKVSCTCSGQYRAKDRKCRHMKEVMKELGING
jgi:hypothetical protein